jgi:hypothetical protein
VSRNLQAPGHSRITDYPEVIHLPVTRTGDNYIMFLGEKELITDSDRTSLLGLRISAALRDFMKMQK